jgi:hypothetical protein
MPLQFPATICSIADVFYINNKLLFYLLFIPDPCPVA